MQYNIYHAKQMPMPHMHSNAQQHQCIFNTGGNMCYNKKPLKLWTGLLLFCATGF